MADVTITIQDATINVVISEPDLTVSLSDDVINVVLPGGASALDTAGTYNSDALAAVGGVAVGGIYWTGPTHEIYPEGALVKRTL